MFTAIATWYIMPIVILIIWMALTFLKKNFAKYWPKRLRIIDIMMLVLLLGIHGLSVTLTGLSLLPFLAFAASAFGLVLTVYLVYTEDDFRVHRFFVIYWRTLDIFIVGMYIILLLIQVASFLGIM